MSSNPNRMPGKTIIDESQVRRLIRIGMSNVDIAKRLTISAPAVSNIKRKAIREMNEKSFRGQISKAASEIERSPQKVCCTYCSLEPGIAFHKEVTVLEGAKEQPFLTIPTGWGESVSD